MTTSEQPSQDDEGQPPQATSRDEVENPPPSASPAYSTPPSERLGTSEDG